VLVEERQGLLHNWFMILRSYIHMCLRLVKLLMKNDPDVYSWILIISLMWCCERDFIKGDTRLLISTASPVGKRQTMFK